MNLAVLHESQHFFMKPSILKIKMLAAEKSWSLFNLLKGYDFRPVFQVDLI